ncbi:helix-turn-helix transcriptional regulator [Yoonia sp. 2307UL14-13]|uniref:helix-turn-helix transcriptional regulator n=1 Tax=Yoonia sp. 2307UL14-13 TaxID=3126506 RepID=UPI0030A2F82F
MDPKARHSRIKKQLLDLGYTIQALADEIGVSRPTVSTVIAGLRTSHRVQSHLAGLLDTTPESLFPERYDKEEKR